MNKTENMATLLLTITQSEEWFRLCDNDEGIKEADDHLQVILDKLAADNPDDMMEQVWDAVCRVNNACCAAAMLYGIRVANSIRDVSAQSLSFTMQALQQSRAEAKRGERTVRDSQTEDVITGILTIKQYVDREKVKLSDAYKLTTKELCTLAKFTQHDIFGAVALAFAYGQTKGYRAATRGR